MDPSQLSEFIRNDQWPPMSPETWTTMSGVRCLRPITSSIQNLSKSLNSKKHCRWSGKARHKNQSPRLLKASRYDWRDAQQLTVNIIGAHKLTVRHETKCRLCCFSDAAVLLRFGTNVFQHLANNTNLNTKHNLNTNHFCHFSISYWWQICLRLEFLNAATTRLEAAVIIPQKIYTVR